MDDCGTLTPVRCVPVHCRYNNCTTEHVGTRPHQLGAPRHSKSPFTRHMHQPTLANQGEQPSALRLLVYTCAACACLHLTLVYTAAAQGATWADRPLCMTHTCMRTACLEQVLKVQHTTRSTRPFPINAPCVSLSPSVTPHHATPHHVARSLPHHQPINQPANQSLNHA